MQPAGEGTMIGSVCQFLKVLFISLIIWTVFPMSLAYAVGDGPRAYQLLPEGTDAFAVYGLFTSGNQSADPGTVITGADLNVNLGIVQYTHTFRLMDQQSALFAVVPFGEVEGDIQTSVGYTVSGSSSGLGDVQLGVIFGLVGSPSLSVEDYLASEPGFALGVLGKLYTPTGEYDDTQALNLGTNRWGTQLGVPMAYSIGSSLVDPSLWRFEFLPSITIYGENDDPYNADTSKKDPLYNVEAHVTRNLSQILWVSLDTLYTYGGETETDGLDDDNTQSAFSLGGSISITVSKSASVKLSYGETIDQNDNGADGWMARAIVNLAF